MDSYHTSVLLQETIDALQVEPGKKYIDATLGGGGHTIGILEKGGLVLGIDADQDAIGYVKKILSDKDIKILSETRDIEPNILVSKYPSISLVKGNFRKIDRIAKENGFDVVDGILFDLGVSSHQLDTAERGFSFLHNAELDMRMDNELQVKAKDLLQVLTIRELTVLFTEYGEERFAKKIAINIDAYRNIKPIETTYELESIVSKSVPVRHQETNPATRVFQALRIAVNDELNSLSEALPKTLPTLRKNGRLVIISFHSLEDRIVKQTFKDWEKKNIGVIITDKPIVATATEVQHNLRSRSAKLRVFEKMQ